jgi:hypothetical protein
VRVERFVVVVGFIATISGCSRPQDTATIRPDPGAAASSSSMLGAVPTRPQATSLASSGASEQAWTDPSVIQALVADCRWQPAQRQDGDPGPLSCDLPFEQSCAPDPCFDKDQAECKPACRKACADCGAKCAATCDDCKRGCTDERCRRSCASICGDCRQACIRDRDHCATATCGQAFAAGSKKRLADWNAGPCKDPCPRVTNCAMACAAKFDHGPGYNDCVAPCKKLMGNCPISNFPICEVGAYPSE